LVARLAIKDVSFHDLVIFSMANYDAKSNGMDEIYMIKLGNFML
jgi:hypothetical protein